MTSLKYWYVMFLAMFLWIRCTNPVRQNQQVELPSNSFQSQYKKFNPGVKYSYNETKQIHDYSGNWDLDGDGKKDALYFVGTGGAHTYYFLRIALSSAETIISYPSIESDFPFLPPGKRMSAKEFDPIKEKAFFAVADFNRDSVADIFLKPDQFPFSKPDDTLKKASKPFKYLLISFKNGKVRFRNFEQPDSN